MTNHLVIYHKDCDDGFGGAWAARHSLGDNARYRAAEHHESVESLGEVDRETSVTMIDIAWSRHEIETLAGKVGSVTVLDHHKTAEQELAGLQLPNLSLTFDKGRSGAVIAWEHFSPDEEVPDLLRYVEDTDLWRFALPNSKEVTAALRSHPRSFEAWDSLRVSDLAREGVSILRSIQRQVQLLVSRAEPAEVAGYRVPTVNTPLLSSEVGNALLDLFPDAPFGATYSIRGGRVFWSLRSRGDFDVGDLAKRFGGGGHPGAAGFSTNSGS